MKIIVVGSGSVGSAICAQLAKEGHDVTIIDRDLAIVNEIASTCDVFGISGNGADVSVLRKAGAEKADILLAATSNDEVNILCCAAAKKLGVKHTIARVRNPEYTELVQLMKDEMSLSLTINPEAVAAKEIYRLLRFPSAAKIDTFCHGRIELAEITVGENSPLAGKTLNDLRTRLNIRFLVCGVIRDNKVYIPSGSFEIEEGDKICVTAAEQDVTEFFKATDMYRQPVKNVLIAGGGRTTYYLEQLLKKSGMSSTVIEKNKALCRELAESFDCTVVCGNSTKQDLLLEEGLDRVDAFLALSGVDEENAIVSMYAKTVKVPKIVTLISTLSYVDFFKNAGLDSIVSPKSSTAALILKYVRSIEASADSEMESLHSILDGRAEALEFIIKDEVDGFTGIALKDIKLENGVLIAAILHENQVIIPSGGDMVNVGDTVIVVTTSGQTNNIKDILK